MSGFAASVTGGLFIAAAAMLWLGRVLLPARVGPFLEAGDFSAIRASFRKWIWLYLAIGIFHLNAAWMLAAGLVVLRSRG